MEAVSYKKPGIKWVNDIFINEKKVCGILAEAAAENGRIRFVVTGIGINFNTPAQSFPDEIRFLAGPVFSNGETAVTREQLIAEILNRLLAEIKIKKSELISKYKSRLITLGKRIEIKTPGKDETYRAEAVDIDDNGRLIIKTENGGLRIFSAGEISTNIN
jgi:BirA family biotin operon repressor/biotin-[acetyl-CoA-carboxylase] ligase